MKLVAGILGSFLLSLPFAYAEPISGFEATQFLGSLESAQLGGDIRGLSLGLLGKELQGAAWFASQPAILSRLTDLLERDSFGHQTRIEVLLCLILLKRNGIHATELDENALLERVTRQLEVTFSLLVASQKGELLNRVLRVWQKPSAELDRQLIKTFLEIKGEIRPQAKIDLAKLYVEWHLSQEKPGARQWSTEVVNEMAREFVRCMQSEQPELAFWWRGLLFLLLGDRDQTDVPPLSPLDQAMILIGREHGSIASPRALCGINVAIEQTVIASQTPVTEEQRVRGLAEYGRP